MSVTVETLENLERKVVLPLAWSIINTKTDEEIRKTAKKANIDGFRPGKAPLKMIAQRYGTSIQNEVINDLIQEEFEKLVRANDLKVLAITNFENVENQDTNGDTLQIAVIYETFPEVKLNDLGALEIEKVSAQVGDEQINQTIEILRKQRTRFNRVERPAQNDDRVIIDFVGKIDGEPFEGGSADNFPFVLGQNQMLPEFEAGILGMQENEYKEVSVHFPADYHSASVADKTAIFGITLKNVSAPELPEIDEQFAKALGIADGDVAKMREEVQKNVLREVNRRLQAQNSSAVMKALRENNPVQLPKTYVQQEAKRLAEEMKQNFAQQGMDANQLQLPEEMFTERAKERVALMFIVPELVEQFKLQASEDQVNALIAEFAESYEDPQEVIDWYQNNSAELQAIHNVATETNLVNFVLDKAKVTEKVLSFDEIMGNNA